MNPIREIQLKTAAYALITFFTILILSVTTTAAFAESVPAAPDEHEPNTSIMGNNPFSLRVEQIFTAAEDTEPPTFTYRLKPLEPGTPMPEGSTYDGYEFKITGNDSLYIGQFSYKNQGVYRYDLSMVVEKYRPGFTYKKRKYYIEVNVIANLTTGVVVLNEDGTKAETILFESSYEAPPEPIKPDRPPAPPPFYPGGQQTLPDIGDKMNPDVFLALSAASGISAILLAVYLRKRRKITAGNK